MPKVSIWMIRMSFLYLAFGISIGALLLISKSLQITSFAWNLLPIHIEFLIIGWIIQFTLGTAYWILPRYLKTKDRGKTLPAIMMVILLNAGILLMVISEAFPNYPSWGMIGRSFQLLAVVLFIKLHWQRIVSYSRVK